MINAKRMRLLLPGVVLVALLCVILVSTRTDVYGPTPIDPGPIHTGRSVEEWAALQVLTSTRDNEALDALVAIGEPAVPYLIQRLRRDSSYLTRSAIYRSLWDKLPQRLQVLVSKPLNVEDEHRRVVAAAYALGRIGKDAEAAVPALIKTLETTPIGARGEIFIVQAIGQIGPSAEDALPVLAARLEERAAEIAATRFDGDLHKGKTTDARRRSTLAMALARIGGSYPEARPKLEELLKTSHDLSVSSAAVALWRIDGIQRDVDRVVSYLRSTNSSIQRSTAILLGHIGPPSSQFVPELEPLASGTNSLAVATRVALRRITGRDQSNSENDVR